MHLKLNRINVIHLKPEGRINTISKYQFLRENTLLFSFKVKRLVLFIVKIRLHSQAYCPTTMQFVSILITVSSTRMNHCHLQNEWQLTFTSRRFNDVQLPYNCTKYSTSSSDSKQHLYSVLQKFTISFKTAGQVTILSQNATVFPYRL